MIRILLFLLLFCSVASAQVIGRGELGAEFRLELSQGRPALTVDFANRTGKNLEIWLPAGALLHGEREPCAPVLLGRDIQLTVPPKASRKVTVEVLSLYPFPHTAGTYQFVEPDPESRRMCKVVQAVWNRHRASRLGGSPLAISQAAVYLIQGVDGNLLAQHCSSSDLDQARSLLKTLGL